MLRIEIRVPKNKLQIFLKYLIDGIEPLEKLEFDFYNAIFYNEFVKIEISTDEFYILNDYLDENEKNS